MRSRTLIAGVLAVSLVGCMHGRDPEPRRVDQSDTGSLRSETVTAATLVKRARSGQWLDTPVTARYQSVAAEAAIAATLGERPVSYVLTQDAAAPRVSSPPHAETVRDHLDSIMVQADWAYSLAGETLVVRDVEQRYFDLHIAPLNRTGQMTLRNLQNSGAGGNQGGRQGGNRMVGGGANAAGGSMNMASLQLNPQQAIPEALRALMDASDTSAKLAYAPSTGVLSAQARPAQMRQIAGAVAALNESLSRRVALDVVLYEVDVSNSQERALNLDVLYDAAIAAQLTYAGSAIVDTTAGGGQLNLSFDEGNRWDGSQVVLNWLNQQGDTEIVSRTRLEAGNLQLVSLEDLVSADFVKSVTRDRNISGATETTAPTVEVETTDTGMAMHIFPVIRDDQVDLQLSLTQAELVGLNSYSFDDGAIAGVLPIVSSNDQVLNLRLRHGESRLVTMLSKEESSSDTASVPYLPLLGDAINRSERKTESVLMITAVVLEG